MKHLEILYQNALTYISRYNHVTTKYHIVFCATECLAPLSHTLAKYVFIPDRKWAVVLVR